MPSCTAIGWATARISARALPPMTMTITNGTRKTRPPSAVVLKALRLLFMDVVLVSGFQHDGDVRVAGRHHRCMILPACVAHQLT